MIDGRDPIAMANGQQAQASDPTASVFVSASAGSGKTKLLIDRLLQLMLPRKAIDPEGGYEIVVPGTPPERIQCLTFTKAAAAEMAIRLQDKLGAWVTLGDDALDRQLTALRITPMAETRKAARELFVRVLDLPGGMRIGTIHAFCQSLLRRFPLEASISPHFSLLDDSDAKIALAQSVEHILATQRGELLATLAGQVGLSQFSKLVEELQKKSHRLAPILRAMRAGSFSSSGTSAAAYRRVLDAPDAAPEAILMDACEDGSFDALRAALRVAQAEGTPKVAAHAAAMLDWLALPQHERLTTIDSWRSLLLTGKGEPRARGGINKKLDDAQPFIGTALMKEAERIIRVDDQVSAVRLVELALALLEVVGPVLDHYAQGKERRGLVDYDDLIEHTRGLLRDPGAAWVLYKLDGGIDHLLLDEVQDTSPEQWRIAADLTSEFFAGAGSRAPDALPRTMFAVGDYKQSIYSFQGADPQGFHQWRQHFQQRVQTAGAVWREPALTVSFRSTSPVLALVDKVFENSLAARGLVEAGTIDRVPGHVSARPGEGGVVEIWPLVPVADSEAEADDAWAAPQINSGQASAPQKLAETLARWVASKIGTITEEGKPALRAADVLVLVPRRSAFVRALIRALKSEDVAVATLVSTSLVDQIAVQDLMALCDTLLLPQDDLSLACVLTSPLGGVSDESLMHLAGAREGVPLWTVLRTRHQERPDWNAAWQMLGALFSRVDYATPHELLVEALGVHGGRARLLARLGPEAAEPVDELLSAALRYESSHPASLQGFLQWLRLSGITVKGEPDAIGDAVRVMTVHGAKGLQSRLVIMPDTMGGGSTEDAVLWGHDRQSGLDMPIWVPRDALSCAQSRALRDKRRREAGEERNRLLYVALTRASDHLLICGWEGARKPDPEAWYGLCRTAFEALGAQSLPFELGWEGNRLLVEERTDRPVRDHHTPAAAVPTGLPGWAGCAPDWKPLAAPVEPALQRPLAPSRPDMVAFGDVPATRSPLERTRAKVGETRLQALAKGSLVHALLEILAECPAQQREARALAWLSRPSNGLGREDIRKLAEQIMAVLEAPELAPLFGPDSRAEQPLAGIVGGHVIVGRVDRMNVRPDGVWVCDYKTNQSPPSTIAQTPVLYLRQMAAYRALLSDIFPDRPIYCCLVWTQNARISVLPETLLDQYAPRNVQSPPPGA